MTRLGGALALAALLGGVARPGWAQPPAVPPPPGPAAEPPGAPRDLVRSGASADVVPGAPPAAPVGVAPGAPPAAPTAMPATSPAPVTTPGAPLPPAASVAMPAAPLPPAASVTMPAVAPTPPGGPVAPPAVGAGAAPSPVAVTAEAGKGLTVRRHDDSFSMTVRARLQLRETLTVGGATTNELGVRTVRLITHGHALTPDLRYLVQLAFGPGDFEPGASSPIFDAWVEYAGVRDAQVRVGQFFVPFDRARTIREFALQLVDRQQVVAELNLDRDAGLTVSSGDLFGLGGRLGYVVGVFGGQGRNRAVAEKPGFLWVARASLRPFGAFDDDVEGDLERLPRPRLALGVAGAYNENAARQRSTVGAAFALGDFDYVHAAGDVVFKYGGVSFLGEVLYRRADADARAGVVDGAEAREWTRSGWGYLAQAGTLLSRRLELAARWNELFALGPTDPALVALARQQGREAGAGLNVYLNGHFLKVQGDYARRFGAGAAGAVNLLRLQLDGTF